ncbi:MAG: hypothetical protein EA361_11380 [Bacteroidetes bacterium]|nr:MAG: hypothetical protein EA361_11380 [Bacteroidota bacterium]
MKRKILWILPVIAILLASCGGAPRETEERTSADEVTISETEQAFLNNLASLCGQSFLGREVYMQEGRESWADKVMVMHVTVCEDTHVHIPFHMDEDTSRTWMFLAEDGRLRFRHDHRYPDGTPEEQTLYGGYADGTGTAFKQHFPADDYTIELLVDTLNRQWNVVLSEDMTNFSYQLQYHGEIVFRADFDLTNPL